MRLLSIFGNFAGRDVHRFFARLHGGRVDEGESRNDGNALPEDFQSIYAAYASATAHANAMLQQHGARSKEFTAADIASMRLFHRTKKIQGLKKPRQVDD